MVQKMKKNILLFLVVGVLSCALGILIISTKELPVANIGGGFIFIGNWAYLVGGIFLLYGIYILYYMFFKRNKK